MRLGSAIFTSGLYQSLHQFGVQDGSDYEQFIGVAEAAYNNLARVQRSHPPFLALLGVFTMVDRRDRAGAGFSLSKWIGRLMAATTGGSGK